MVGSYKYYLLAPSGKKQKGIVYAESLQSAQQKVRERGLVILSIKQQTINLSWLTTHFYSLNSRTIMLFFRQLHILLSSSMTLSESLAFISHEERNISHARLYNELHQGISEGKRFSDMLRQYPRIFSPAISAIIRAGEESGHMSDALVSLTHYLERRHELRGVIIQASAYPILLITVSLFIISVLMAVAIPAIADQLVMSDIALPLSTRMLIGISQFISSYWLEILIFKTCMFWLLKILLKQNSFRMFFDQNVLRVPILGKALTNGHYSLLLITIEILTIFAVPVLDAFLLARSVVSNVAIKSKLEMTCELINQGKSISHALVISGLFDKTTIALLRAGEKSGQFQKMVKFSSDLISRETTARIQSIMKVFEPLLIFGIGLIVLFIFMSIMQPMLQLNNIPF